MNKCLVCESTFSPFISFGDQPIANGFLKEEDFGKEYLFEMKVGYCDQCHMVQLTEQPDREKMFHDQYPFYSSLSNHMQKHFRSEGEEIFNSYLNKDSFVVEVGCNDGIFLQYFKDKGMKHLGIEPSSNVAEAAKEKGINAWSTFFDEDVAKKAELEYGKADLVFSANVICHIPYIHSIAKGIESILSDKGVFVFEDPYLGDIIEKTSYDQIYDEHVFFFSAHSVSTLFSRHGLELIDVKKIPTHGGSMRYTLARSGAFEKSNAVNEVLKHEEELGLTKFETYEKFSKNVENSKKNFVALLEKLKSEGKSVAGYGATSKSTTVLNYCGVGPNHISFISDTTPMKQEKFTPGTHIPVKSREYFGQNTPDYIVLFAWNHKKEIIENEPGFEGRWITYIPDVHVF